MNIAVRHPGPELMDRNDIPKTDLYRNYQELHAVNKLLGGYRITLKGLSRLAAGMNTLSLLDIGCGGGDMLKTVALWGRKNNLKLRLTGIDSSAAAIHYSRKNCKPFPEIDFVEEDVFQHLSSAKNYDVIMNTLFMHHFSDEQIIRLLLMMKAQAEKGFIINDLQRHWLAYYSIKWLTQLFSRSYLVKNDAPLSVMRGFRQDEWWYLLSRAYIVNAEISWEWAFRYLIVYRKNHSELDDGDGALNIENA